MKKKIYKYANYPRKIKLKEKKRKEIGNKILEGRSMTAGISDPVASISWQIPATTASAFHAESWRQRLSMQIRSARETGSPLFSSIANGLRHRQFGALQLPFSKLANFNGSIDILKMNQFSKEKFSNVRI